QQRDFPFIGFLYRSLPLPLDSLWPSPHVERLDKGKWRNRHGSHGRRFEGWQKVYFGIWYCGGNHDRSADCYRRRRQKRGTEHSSIECGAAGNQRLAEPVAQHLGASLAAKRIENGAAHG